MTLLGVVSIVRYVAVVSFSFKSLAMRFTLIIASIYTVWVGVGDRGSPPSDIPMY